ncbi:hypothetical protein OCJ37_20510 [Xanthomonas sp. AM6]|uniref:hypothetical protein n=1 Tax=Xanthomonas sp. AM6 TaxID=2982531 RepID=UPI0021D902AE|nr:hypothetical protein [Xanthomonas sp. AM6]UYB52311.1 hypothetical protein OCJ37_20510 [Xanthomonas sp. AM6]
MDTFATFLRLRAGATLLAMAFATLANAQELRFDQKYIECSKQSSGHRAAERRFFRRTGQPEEW